MIKDPLRVTYNDMIADTEEKLKWMKRVFPGRVIAGKMSQWHATHRIEMEKTKLRIFQALKGMNAKFIDKNSLEKVIS